MNFFTDGLQFINIHLTSAMLQTLYMLPQYINTVYTLDQVNIIGLHNSPKLPERSKFIVYCSSLTVCEVKTNCRPVSCLSAYHTLLLPSMTSLLPLTTTH